jgi:hypothetical protein
MQSPTKYKLEEAAFFLDHLKKNRGKAQAFDFYLSAFINAARSVHWVMNAEYTHVDGYRKWSAAKEKVLPKEIQELFKGTNDMRINAVKRGSLKASPFLFIKTPQMTSNMFKSLIGKLALMKEVTVKMPAVDIFHQAHEHWPKQVKEFPFKDVLEVCQTYYDQLKKSVDECASLFDSS